jgi:ABC-type nitrate/sulfonate/bicarbonate transport system substrate-binding protein
VRDHGDGGNARHHGDHRDDADPSGAALLAPARLGRAGGAFDADWLRCSRSSPWRRSPPAATPGGGGGSERVRLEVAILPIPDFAPPYLVTEKGFFEHENLVI